jgi:hypothetical protein
MEDAMRRFSAVALFSLLACFLLTLSPVQSTASVPEVVPGSGPEVEGSADEIVGMYAVPDAETTYDLYKAKAALAQKVETSLASDGSEKCSEVAMLSRPECEAANGASCSCDEGCDCTAGEESCSCDCGWLQE